MTRHSHAPAVTRRLCRRCGDEVDEFRTHYGRYVRLETEPLPITTDLVDPDLKLKIWEWLGDRLGWSMKYSPQRTWRELRKEHECASPSSSTSVSTSTSEQETLL